MIINGQDWYPKSLATINMRSTKSGKTTFEISDISYVLNLPDTPAVGSSSGKENLGVYLGEI